MLEKIIICILMFCIIALFLEILFKIQNMYYSFKNQRNMKKYKGKYVLVKIIRDDNGNYKDIYYVNCLRESRRSSSSQISEALFFDNQKEAFKILKKYDWDMSILQL